MLTTTSVVETTDVVKPGEWTIGRGAAHAHGVLHDRIDWICRTDKIGIPEVARRGKVSRQAVNRLALRSRQGKPGGSARTLAKIAAGNRVSFEWLATGQGQPRAEGLSVLEHVLQEREWSAAATAAARASMNASRTHGEWRRFLIAVEVAETTPDPPSTGVRRSIAP